MREGYFRKKRRRTSDFHPPSDNFAFRRGMHEQWGGDRQLGTTGDQCICNNVIYSCKYHVVWHVGVVCFMVGRDTPKPNSG